MDGLMQIARFQLSFGLEFSKFYYCNVETGWSGANSTIASMIATYSAVILSDIVELTILLSAEEWRWN